MPTAAQDTKQHPQHGADAAPDSPFFQRADRCDHCDAQQARVRIAVTGLPLDFCGHCFSKAEDALPEGSEVSVDERHLV